MILEQPSTSQGAGFIAENYELQDEGLDYEEDELEEGEMVQYGEEQNDGCKRFGFNGVWSLGVLPEPAEKVVRSDCRDGVIKKTVVAVHLPRGVIYLWLRNSKADQQGKGHEVVLHSDDAISDM
ncbi:hypothetical protein NDU88_006971 [Pleurodeles waltl]|uniref:Uncharacterized protein n=1 Tax=Pleurodeles waltl TaxID=8319 RepID=A0AAV7PL64_PLEWA|nr:hypothetical protein NDU88_006971 [Pleurodeles waltl]